MKSFLSVLVLTFFFSFSTLAQEGQIPIAVERAFKRIQPETQVYWDLENEFQDDSFSFDQIPKRSLVYTGQFIECGTILAHVFNGNGKYIRKEVDINSNDLPALAQFLITSELKHPVSKASKWMVHNGAVQYFVRLGHESYLFNEFGNNLGKYEL